MLLNLSVRNFVLVKELEFSLQPGLTAITGESGAGKSILMDALSLVLGSRASRLVARPGSSHCEVVAEFDLSDSPVANALLDENEWLDDELSQRCIVRRTVRTDGRSRAWINGTAVNASALRSLCRPLVEVHGQFTQQQLSDTEVQLEWLDDYGTSTELLEEVGSSFGEWRRQAQKMAQVSQTLEATRQRTELLTYQLDELDDLDLGESEFKKLTRHHKRVIQAQETKGLAGQALDTLGGSAFDELVRLRQQLDQIEDDDGHLHTARELLAQTDVHIDEGRMALQRYLETLEFDPDELQRTESRLDRIHTTARKHRVSANDLFSHAQQLRRELESLKSVETDIAELRSNVQQLECEYTELSAQLHDVRKRNAPKFVQAVQAILKQVALPNVSLRIDFSATQNARGNDAIDYMITTGEGFDPLPVRRIASGGEMARIALAIMVVVARKSRLPCLVLDEADIGVGGVTADTVGRMLRNLSEKSQILCVTHAPQVAALADNHLRVFRNESDDIEVEQITDANRVEEIARMVGGQDVNRESRNYAQSLINGAHP